jgi:hypothetical protein
LFVSGAIVLERKSKPIGVELTNCPPIAGQVTDSCISGSVKRKIKPIGVELTNCPPIAGQVTDSCFSVPGGTSAEGGARWEA